MASRTWAIVALHLVLAMVFCAPVALRAQAAASGQRLRTETADELVSRLTPTQAQIFDAARQAAAAGRYPEAFARFQTLLADLPGDRSLTKFAADAALNADNVGFVVNSLTPIVKEDPDDWQSVAMLTRACAQSGDKRGRDAGIVHMIELHQRGVVPAGMQRYIVEQVRLGDKVAVLWISLVPWGPYHVYYLGQFGGADGKINLRTTVESNDGDQVLFAREHPEEAAAGRRSFSIDAYRSTGANSNGQQTQTHETYGFLTTQPTYEMVRQRFVAIALGKDKPLSTRSGLIVP